MKIKFLFYGLFVILSVLSACNSNKKIKKDNTKQTGINTNHFSVNQYFNNNDSIQIIPNKKGDLILYLSETLESPGNPVKDIHFVIYNKMKDSVIYENKFSNSTIKWHTNRHLKLTRFYGITEKPDGTNIKYQLIDAYTGEIQVYNNTNIK